MSDCGSISESSDSVEEVLMRIDPKTSDVAESKVESSTSTRGGFRGRGRGFRGRGRSGKIREWGSASKPQVDSENGYVKRRNFDVNVIIEFVKLLNSKIPTEEFVKFNIHRFDDKQFAKIMECVNCFKILVEQNINYRINAEKMLILATRFNLDLYTQFLSMVCSGKTAFKNNEIIDYVKVYISKIKNHNILKTVCGITRTTLINATHVSRVCMLKELSDTIPELMKCDIVELKHMRTILAGHYSVYSKIEDNPYIGLINSLLAGVDKKIKMIESA